MLQIVVSKSGDNREVTISVCYIVKNESRFLEASLKSVSAWADEIVIVDTGSTDSTVQMARQYADHFEFFHWKDDFSAARNYAAGFCTSDWILFLDGDEVLDEQSSIQIQELVKNPAISAWGLIQRNYSANQQMVGWRSVALPVEVGLACGISEFSGAVDNIMFKLYRNHLGISWSGEVHETIIHSCREMGLKWEETEIVIHHLAAFKGDDFLDQKKQYYHRLSQIKLKRQPTHENSWYELGISSSNIGDFGESEKCFSKALQLRPDWPEVQLLYARTLLQLEKFQEAERELRKLFETSYMFSEVVTYLTTALLYQGKFEALRSILDLGDRLEIEHPHFHINSATYWYELGDYSKCYFHLRKAEALNPKDTFVMEALERVKPLAAANELV